eukprot:16433682-Heterocapsa_arctica.AAC.1
MEFMRKIKNSEMEGERTKTEESDEEEDKYMTGARGHVMTKRQESDIRKWMDDNPTLKADAMDHFDKKQLEGIVGTDRV